MKATLVIDGETFNQIPPQTRNDYGFNIQFNVKEEDDSPFVLQNHAIVFKASRIEDSLSTSLLTISSPCIISDASSGIVLYTVATSDFQTSGVYYAELQVTTSGVERTAKLGRFLIQDDL